MENIWQYMVTILFVNDFEHLENMEIYCRISLTLSDPEERSIIRRELEEAGFFVSEIPDIILFRINKQPHPIHFSIL